VNLIIAIGNRLRRDDGTALRVVELLPADLFTIKTCMELLPEISLELAGHQAVVFVDACDCGACEPSLAPAGECERPASIVCHSFGPSDIVALARMSGFSGRALVCCVPGQDFGMGEGLSPVAERNAHLAARLLEGEFRGKA
jgi:hydrogenase maturation protease